MNAFRAALEQGDAGELRRLWAIHRPYLPPLASDAAAEIALHTARTASESVALALRRYSHAWLEERGLPSSLPTHLRPPERREPRIVSAVGVSVKARSPERREMAREIERAMAEVAGLAITAGVTDMQEVRRAMQAARRRVLAQGW